MRYAMLLALCSVTACASDPVVLTDIAEPLECPEPELRQPTDELTTPLVIETPDILPADEGDYGLTRQGAELLIDGIRALREREALWRSWGVQ